MRRAGKVLSALIVAVAIAFASTGALAQNIFQGTISDDWSEAGNWSYGTLPSPGTGAHIGNPAAPGVSATLYSGIGECGSLRIGYDEDGSLTIKSGATLMASGGFYPGAYDSDASGNVGTLVVEGIVDHAVGNFNIGRGGDAMVTIAPGGTITTSSWGVIGKSYSGSATERHNVTINQLGGLFHSSYFSTTAVEFYSDATHTNIYKMSGGTINVPNGGWWNLGGTFEVAGQVQINTNMQFISGWFGDVTLKFSGTDPLFTSPQAADFGDPNVRTLTYVDVSELTLSTPNTWVSVMDCPEILNPDNVALLPGTASEWSMQYDAASGDLQLKYAGGPIMGDVNLSGLVDDDDLSLLLANWNAGTTWGTGDLNASGNVDDDDLSLLLANWNAGTPPLDGSAVPEPATLGLLALGGLALMRRASR